MRQTNDVKRRSGATPVTVDDRPVINPSAPEQGAAATYSDMLPLDGSKLQPTGSGFWLLAAVGVVGFFFFRSNR